MTPKTLFLLVTTPLLMTLPAFGSDSCVHISGTYPQCKITRSVDPEVDIQFSDVKIQNSSDIDFTIDMTMDGEASTSNVKADGKEYVGVDDEGKPLTIKTLCEKSKLVVLAKNDLNGYEIENRLALSKKNGVLTITQFVFEDVWQVTTCQ